MIVKSLKELLKKVVEDAYKDHIHGGIADERKPSEFNQKNLRLGVQHELEHTDNIKIAREIAMDHLTEDPDYYQKLKE